ncbi:aryl-alcohol dehydrogenase [Bisporella sp. PMI_857]|nr:aryl-alcohol dehydrogenase [Bisporella sp. PMI_857]
MLVDSPGQFASKRYDYVIVGGGTAGLVLAARLTEDPDVSVGVIEAGKNHLADPTVLVPGMIFGALGNANYDWRFQSVPQKHINNRIIGQNRGKGLGGSSAINGMMCTYASKRDIDSWEKLGNPGWAFDDLAPYYEKFSSFTEPSKETEKHYSTDDVIDPKLHEVKGPIKTSFPVNKKFASKAWVSAFDNLGLKQTVDPQSGRGNGGYSSLITVDPSNSTRSYSATGYFQPNAGRPNLTVLVNAHATKITFDDRQGKQPRASGVDFISAGSNYHVEADHEVLICSGAFQSPHLLELSGIGSKKILEPLGIDVIVNNANVGENLQDHATVPISFETEDNAITYDDLEIAGFAEAATQEFYNDQGGLFTSLITNNANLSYHQVDAQVGHVSPTPIKTLVDEANLTAPRALKKQYALLGDAILDPKDSAYQFIYIPIGFNLGVQIGTGPQVPGNFLTIETSISRVYSRGSVHIASKDPLAPPLIDPNYLSHPLDLELFANGALFLQHLARTEPLAKKLKDGGRALRKGYYELNKENAKQFVKEGLSTEYHPLGSCAMLPEKEGGVVDTKLRVYGVKGLRVMDASVFPMEIRNNLQTTVYAVAEKAADIIKADWRAKREAVNGGKRSVDEETVGEETGKRVKRF